MRRLKELNSLISMARALGQEPAPELLEEFQRLESIQERVKQNIARDLTEIFSQATIDERKVDAVIENIQQIEPLKYELDDGPLTDAQYNQIQELADIPVLENEETWAQRVIDQQEDVPDVAQQIANSISRQMATEGTVVRPEAEMPAPTAALEQKVKYLEKWISRIAATGAGSGEVNFRWLDDVNRASINDNWVLEYNAATKKFQFTNVVGPIETLIFDTAHDVATHSHDPGAVCWNNIDRTINIFQPNGVTQQVGQEQYYLIGNTSGTTIANGSFVRFAGATMLTSGARILGANFIANGSSPNLYAMGIATETIDNNSVGFVTCFGKVRELDTTGTPVGEVWQHGDILYGHPTVTGALTRVKPTAPNNVISVAAVLHVDATEGEIFVRPVIEHPSPYARYRITSDISSSSVNTSLTITGYETVVANGFYTNSSHTGRIYATTSGFYDFDLVLQLRSTNSSAQNIWVWAHLHDGTSVATTARRKTLVGNNVYDLLSCNFAISMAADDYVELHYAVDSPNIILEATPANAFAPQAPSVSLTVTQIAL